MTKTENPVTEEAVVPPPPPQAPGLEGGEALSVSIRLASPEDFRTASS